MVKEKKGGGRVKGLAGKIPSKKILKESKHTLTIPNRKVGTILSAENQFFNDEFLGGEMNI